MSSPVREHVIMHISSLSTLMVMELEIIELKASIKRDLFISKPQYTQFCLSDTGNLWGTESMQFSQSQCWVIR